MEDDFNPREAIREINATLRQPNEFAKVFCQAASIDKSIDIILKKIIIDLINTDYETRNSLKELLREVVGENWKSLLNKIGFAAWSIIVALVTALILKYFS